MKKPRNGFIKNLRYVSLIGVIALGFITIIATGGGGNTDPNIEEDSYFRYFLASSIDYASLPEDRTDYTPMGSGSYAGQTYYVATNGSNGNDGLTQSTPFRTIQYALRMSQDGDTVWVRGGTYRTGDLTSDYDEQQQIHSNFILAAWPEEKVIIQSDDLGEWEHRDALSLRGPLHDVIIDGFEFRDFTNTGIQFGNETNGENPQRNIIIKNIIIKETNEGITTHYDPDGQAASKVYIDGLLVKNVLLLDITGIGFNAGQRSVSGYALYQNIHIDGLKIRCLSGGEGSGADCLAFENGFNILVENTLAERAYADGIDLKADQVAVLNCIVRHTGRNGVKCWQKAELINVLSFDTGADANVVFDTSENISARDCVFAYHNARSGQSSYSFTVDYDHAASSAGQVNFTRCIFFANTDWGFIPGGAQLHFEGNIFWAIFTEGLFEHYGANPNGYTYDTIDVLNNQLWGADNQVTDPGFENPSYDANNLVTGNMSNPGFKDILIDDYFTLLENS